MNEDTNILKNPARECRIFSIDDTLIYHLNIASISSSVNISQSDHTVYVLPLLSSKNALFMSDLNPGCGSGVACSAVCANILLN